MKILLDTHILLWWLADSRELRYDTRDVIGNPDNLVWVSVASIWEIVIKKALGKLQCPSNLEEALAASHFEILDIGLAHVLEIEGLPRFHEDPFDRMLIAQARVEKFTLVTRDEKIQRYSVSILQA